VAALGMSRWSQQVPRPPTAVQYVQVGYMRAGGRLWGLIQASGWSWWLSLGVLATRCPTDFLIFFLNLLLASNGHLYATHKVSSPTTCSRNKPPPPCNACLLCDRDPNHPGCRDEQKLDEYVVYDMSTKPAAQKKTRPDSAD
jgi:hypothetical protein